MSNQRETTSWIDAEWPAPRHIRAGTTTRLGGCSKKPYDSLNLAQHVGDSLENVETNREYIRESLALPSAPVWLEQVHGNRIIHAEKQRERQADGIYTENRGTVCVIMTADCVPLFLCNSSGNRISAIHVGWRGFCKDIVHAAIALYDVPNDILVWIGPHITQSRYEVGEDVYNSCIEKEESFEKAFEINSNGRWQASLQTLICLQLRSAGVKNIYCANLCTYDNSSLFYSYRRSGNTGRMASLIWME